MTAIEQPLSGWGRFPVERCWVSRPESLDSLRRTVIDGGRESYVARGLGRSYGDSAQNHAQGVVDQTRLDRFLGFDEQTGVLSCEAGVSIAGIIEQFLPRGWFVPTTPGTKFVTVGGAIAADIHGKNHHVDGSWGSFVRDLDLLVASGDVVRCSPTQDPELFWATVGGMGLTGVIVSARIQLMAVESAYYDVEHRRLPNLDALLEASRATEQTHRYSVAWVDCLAGGSQLGRSVLMLGNDARAADLPDKLRRDPLRIKAKPQVPVPIDCPGAALNQWSVKAFNTAFYASHGDSRGMVDYDTYFYPLDGVHAWNRIYGRRGFVQYQALFPHETARAGLVAMLETIVKSRRASFLAVLKSSGAANPSPLSYLFPGQFLALDFPNTGDDLLDLCRRLDRILLDHGGRLYLAKDTLMNAETFRLMYPRLDEFKAVKARVDPDNRFVSSQARRLGIV